MRTGFVDTGAWIALLVPNDKFHRRARAFFQTIAGDTRLITSNYVMAETLTWLSYNKLRPAAYQLLSRVEAAEKLGYMDTEWVSAEIHEQAVDIFRRFDDQDYSICDCTSFVVCERRRVDFAFGFDAHFRTMGIEVRPGAEDS